MKVIDHFLRDPDAVRQSALASGFGSWSPKKGLMGLTAYAGLNFYGDHATIIETLYKTVGLIGFPNSMLFRVTNEDTERAMVHSDAGAGDVTCIVYLSQHEDKYGTGFYRNKRTGSVVQPPFTELLKDHDEFARLKREIDESKDEDWEELEFVQGRYNRALIFKSHHFHRRFPEHGIGTDETSGRLIWIGHFREAQL
jgi:Family of unknown function (DUF6445)